MKFRRLARDFIPSIALSISAYSSFLNVSRLHGLHPHFACNVRPVAAATVIPVTHHPFCPSGSDRKLDHLSIICGMQQKIKVPSIATRQAENIETSTICLGD